ncbi:hypothetical protein ACLB1R_07175 [Escherichia coli]
MTLLPYQVWRHAHRYASVGEDKLIYEEKDDTYYVSLHKTASKHYVVVHLASATTSEVRLLDAEMADAEPFVSAAPQRSRIRPRSLPASFLSAFQPPRQKLWLIPSLCRDEQQWEELIPPRENIMLEGFTLFTDWLVVEERQRGLTSLRQINRKKPEIIGFAWFIQLLTVMPTIQNLKPRDCVMVILP